MENNTGKKIICRFCAAEFDDMQSKCPYCGSTNYKGAEAEYFDRLEDVRDDMEELEAIPKEETKKAFKSQGRFLKIVFLVMGIIALLFGGLVFWSENSYKRDEKADFLWKEENFPYMDELYAQGKYEELIEFYFDDSNEDAPVWEWEHSDFCETYDDIEWLNWYLELEASGKKLTRDNYTSILYYELNLIGVTMGDMNENDVAYFAEDIEAARADFEERFHMSEEDYNDFMKKIEDNNGWIGFTECEDYIKDWYKKR